MHTHIHTQWGGERDKRHGTILIQAMIRRGLLYDAWQGLLISEETEAMLALPYRELLLSVINILSHPNKGINSNHNSNSNTNLKKSTNSYTNSNLNININNSNGNSNSNNDFTDVQGESKIKLNESQHVEVAAFCIFALMKIEPRENL